VNANPSGSRTPSTGCRGGLDTRKELAATSGPPLDLRQLDVLARIGDETFVRLDGSNGGTRHAKTVCRGALRQRRAAQGRVGDQFPPRQIAHHLVSHLLLSAKTSAQADVVRPFLSGGARTRSAKESTNQSALSWQQAQPEICSSLPAEARNTRLVQPGGDVTPTLARGLSRGKGVLAA
jgi:hypothetical protein